MKLMGMILVMAGSIGLGIWYSLSYQRKLQNLKNWKKAMLIIRGEIAFGRTPLLFAMEQVIVRGDGTIRDFFQSVSEKMQRREKSLEEIWAEEVEEMLTKAEMTEIDRKEIQELGTTLGYLDVEMQLQTIDLHLQRINQSMEEKEKEKRNKTKLYPVLGTMCGVMVCIILG